MTKLLLLLLLCTGIAFTWYLRDAQSDSSPTAQQSVTPSVTPSTKNGLAPRKSLFVPYWTLSNRRIRSDAERFFYFGIATNKQGINYNEDGYKKIQQFLDTTPENSEKYLTLRMINTDVNFEILKNTTTQDKIISESISIAQEHNFDGIVLDLESSSLSFDAVINRISNFIAKYYKEVKKSDLTFIVAVYGDTFYRSRPYDIPHITNNSDEVVIMAYDFHKSRGNPGPNFPFEGKEKYGYDFKTMIADFRRFVPNEKFTVTFGLFGYDWIIDSEGRSEGSGAPLALVDIQGRFIATCKFSDCKNARDSKSQGSFVTYTDEEQKHHMVWYEDVESVELKQKYLEELGITSTALWAYSYY